MSMSPRRSGYPTPSVEQFATKLVLSGAAATVAETGEFESCFFFSQKNPVFGILIRFKL